MKTTFDGVQITYPVGMSETEAIYYAAEQKELQPKLNLTAIEIKINEDNSVDIIPTYDTITRVRRITGYLSNVKKFNDAKKQEAEDRVTHFGDDKNWVFKHD